MLPAPLRGIVTPLITPLNEDETLDIASLERLLHHVIAGGVHAVFVLGTTGEGPGVSPAVRREVVSRTCKLVGGRVPVLVGITDSAFASSIDFARFAAEAGAQAVVTAGPIYYPVTQNLLLHYIERVASSSPLPVILYNIPSCAHVHFALETVVRAASSIGNVAGVKDSSGNIGFVHQLRYALSGYPNFTLLVGPEELMAESVMAGVHGGVNGGSNLFPPLYSSLYAAAAKRDMDGVARLHPIVEEVCSRIFEQSPRGEHFLPRFKYAASLLGLCGETVTLPYRCLTDSEKVQVRQAVDELKSMMP